MSNSVSYIENSNGRFTKSGCSFCFKIQEKTLYQSKNPYENITNFPYVEVRFKIIRSDIFYCGEQMNNVRMGEMVVVESQVGWDMGTVVLSGTLVAKKIKSLNRDKKSKFFRVLRYPTKDDMKIYLNSLKEEKKIYSQLQTLVRKEMPNIKIVYINLQADGKILYVYFKQLQEERTNIPETASYLSGVFNKHVIIQILNDRISMGCYGGIGSCGRETCCSTFLRNPGYVSTSSLKPQIIYYNPDKYLGLCGRLKCCINYELDFYQEAQKSAPKIDTIETAKGKLLLHRIDYIRKKMQFKYETGEIITLDYGEAAKIKEANKRGDKPEV